jgi:uncharacterized protein (DUF1697 family)
MPQLVALLRAINVGRHSRVRMDALREAFESLGFARVATYIASGNVLFETRVTDEKKLARMIEKRLRERFGFDAATFLRTRAELEEVINREPFRPSKQRDVADNIIFVADPVDGQAARELVKLSNASDQFRVPNLRDVREVYWRRRKVPGNYKTLPLEKVLRQQFTVRTVSTVAKIAALAAHRF